VVVDANLLLLLLHQHDISICPFACHQVNLVNTCIHQVNDATLVRPLPSCC
jgi:hypothetical protein